MGLMYGFPMMIQSLSGHTIPYFVVGSVLAGQVAAFMVAFKVFKS